ncbi:MAG: glycosyltransferase family 2 protein [Planctomycetota bacterium]|nr:glycosyltransferase family 2 protein [Planctomycetota bacterium]
MTTAFLAQLLFLGDASWLNQPVVRWSLTGAYIAVLLLVALYGLHRYWLVMLYYRNRGNVPRPDHRFEQLPPITVQLPMFNEASVAQRVIDAACALDYPRALLQIQVLDDSTDESAGIARERVEYWVRQGMDIQYIHRTDRSGYKAGALEHAMPQVRGQFIAIFDADFVPPANFLKRSIHHFTDPTVGMVQARWDHINRNESLLTRSQAIFLDGHFVIEHTARNRSDCWINFNGTAGVWRREAIESAGGWHHDTLTEDVDLSYRAQLKGWRFVFLQRLGCPAELPPEINAFKSQQHRWTKGSIQTAKKLLPALLRSKAPLHKKIEAFFHLTGPMVYLYVTLMVLLLYPAFYVNMQPVDQNSFLGVLWALSLFALGTTSAGVFYVASQRAQRRSALTTLLQMPMLMSIGVGVALNNSRGCIEALLGHDSPFVRTPKYNALGAKGSRGSTSAEAIDAPEASIDSSLESQSDPAAPAVGRRPLIIATPSIKLWMSLLELAMGAYTLECARLSLNVDHTIVSLPFLLLFAAGYLYVGFSSLWSQFRSWRLARETPVLQPQ